MVILMDEFPRHQRDWRLIHSLVHGPVCRMFNFSYEDYQVQGPILLIPNHSCAWDPLLVGSAHKDKQVYFVASEHLFRLGLVSKVIEHLVAPIPRRKASSGADTVKACLRHLRAGHSVCLCAEGEQSWTGRNIPVFPATGKLARSSGATLVTYKLEGAYLSLPRWGKGIRCGRVYGHPVGIYPPDLLKTMSPDEINTLINRDIAEDAWERQRSAPVAFRWKKNVGHLVVSYHIEAQSPITLLRATTFSVPAGWIWNTPKPASFTQANPSQRWRSGMTGSLESSTAASFFAGGRMDLCSPTAVSLSQSSPPATVSVCSPEVSCSSMRTVSSAPGTAFRS